MKCENCSTEHDQKYGSGRFCSSKCARGFATKAKRTEINKKVSSKLLNRKLSENHKKNIEKATNFNRKEKTIRYCVNCKVDFLCIPSNKRIFCSSVCFKQYSDRKKTPFALYKQQCLFDFKCHDFPNKFDLDLISKYGWYSPSNKGNNLNGISRDHMFSISEGFKKGIHPSIIKHPANCKLMPHGENQSKRHKSSITLDELLDRIENW